MTYDIITREDLERFRLQLLNDLTQILNRSDQAEANKEWLRSCEVRKMLGISNGTLQNLRIRNLLPYKKIGGLMFYKYQDIVKLLEGDRRETYGEAA